MKKPQFGELCIGVYAGVRNPHRTGFFVRERYNAGRLNHGRYWELTDRQGDFWEYPLEAVRRVCFIEVNE